MSLFNFLKQQPTLQAHFKVSVGFDTPFGLIGKTCESDPSVLLPISVSNLPDIYAGDGSNNLFQGNAGGPDKAIPVSFQITYSIPESPISCKDETTNISFDLPLPDTGRDVFFGFGGDDTLNGGDDTDIIVGDSFSPADGGFGNDNLNGEAGDDFAIAGGGNDRVTGGAGKDVLFGDYFLGLVKGKVNLNFGEIAVPGSFGGGNFKSFFRFGGEGSATNVKIQFGNFEVPIGSGNEGNDTISGGAGEDLQHFRML
jgi:Ca2+-binding RTX toxin-like protein